jgi:hypothetical protein
MLPKAKQRCVALPDTQFCNADRRHVGIRRDKHNECLLQWRLI